MPKEKGLAPVFILLLVAAVVVLLVVLVRGGKVQLPSQLEKLPGVGQPKELNVSLKKEYKNPFDKSAQYVNPFLEYKNPFDNLLK